jgi:hypothetical protein
MTVMPVYAFVQGDTMGIVVLAHSDGTAADLAEKMMQATAVRVARRPSFRVMAGDRVLDLGATLRMQGLEPLERVDLVWE